MTRTPMGRTRSMDVARLTAPSSQIAGDLAKFSPNSISSRARGRGPKKESETGREPWVAYARRNALGRAAPRRPMSIDIVRGELERLFSLDEMIALSSELLGFEPSEIG